MLAFDRWRRPHDTLDDSEVQSEEVMTEWMQMVKRLLVRGRWLYKVMVCFHLLCLFVSFDQLSQVKRSTTGESAKLNRPTQYLPKRSLVRTKEDKPNHSTTTLNQSNGLVHHRLLYPLLPAHPRLLMVLPLLHLSSAHRHQHQHQPQPRNYSALALASSP